MAIINSKKLLPGSETKEVFLVPTKSIIPSAPKLEGVKPDEKKTSKTPLLLEGKVIQVTELFNNSLLLKAADRERKRKDEERKEFDEREKKLEENKLGKKGQQGELAAKIPGSSLFDRLARFTGFTLLGFIFNNYSNLLPKLNALGAILKPAAEGIGYFAEGLLSNTIDWIDRGYKAYDTVRDWTKKLGGENFQKLFDDFSGALNLLINGAIIAGAAGIRGGLFKNLKPKFGGATSGAATAARFGLTPEQQRAIIFNRQQAIERELSKRGVASDILKRNRHRIATAKTQAQQNAIMKEILEIGDTEIRGGVTEGSAGTRGLIQDKGIKEKILKRDKEFARKVTMQVPGAPKSGVKQPVVVETLLQTLYDPVKDEVVDVTPKRVKNVPITGRVFDPDLGVELPTEKYRRPISEGPREVKAIKLGKEQFSPKLGKRTRKLSIPGLGTKTFSAEVAKTLEFMAREYGPDDLTVASAFRDPDFYSYEIGKERRAMLRARGTKVAPRRSIRDVLGKEAASPSSRRLASAGSPGAASQVGKQVARTASRGSRIIPFIGPLLDFAISWASGDPPGEAAAAAIGAGIGGWIGTLFVGAGTFGIGALLGGAIGGFIGDYLGRQLYKATLGKKSTKGYAQGGIVDPKRKIKTTSDRIKKYDYEPSPVELRPLFSDAKLKFLYGSEGSIKLIKSISGNLAGVGGFIGSLMSASINLLFGQKFDGALLKYIGIKYGKSTENLTRIASDSIVRMVQNQLAYGERTDPKTGEKQGFLSWAAGLLGLDGSSDDAPPIQKPPSQKPTQGSLAPVLPKGNPVFTSGFGSRWGRQHKGIDIGVDAGSPVTALDEGKVLDIYPNFGGNGVGIVVQHSDGTKIVYGHVNSNVNIGDTVKKGQIIATVKGWYNAYGNKNNTHLHLERYVDGSAVDPSEYLNSIEKIKLDKVSSLQKQNPELLAQTPVYAKNQEFTYVVQPVIMA